MSFQRPSRISVQKGVVMPVVSKPSDYLALYARVMWLKHKPRVILGAFALILSILYTIFFGAELAWLIPWALGAWITPSTRATGDLITATIWNQDVVDNVQFIGDEYAYAIHDATQTAVDIGAGAGDLFDITIPGDAMGTDGVLFVDAWFRCSTVMGGNDHDFAVIYGGTTMATNSNMANNNAGDLFHFQAMMSALGVTNSQRVGAELIERELTDDVGDSRAVGFSGTAAEDSTGDLSFKLRWTAGTSGVLTTIGVVAYIKGGGVV